MKTNYTSADVATAEEHVLQAERHVARQRRIIDKLTRLGRSVVLARESLADFERALLVHRSHLQKVRAA
jgi:hypothetical protein